MRKCPYQSREKAPVKAGAFLPSVCGGGTATAAGGKAPLTPVEAQAYTGVILPPQGRTAYFIG